MDHSAIAKVFDAGATPEGRPFFVMELVRGEPICRFADRHRLSTRERLELFIRVCDGVQHAHQKAIIHRDLKPSNILVAEEDGAQTLVSSAPPTKIGVATPHSRNSSGPRGSGVASRCRIQ